MRILVATDGSEAAGRAVSFAAALAKKVGAHLKIVHIITSRDVPGEQLGDYALREHTSSAEVMAAFSDEKLKDARQRAESVGLSGFESESRSETDEGDIAGAIMSAAHRDKSDLIVLGKRGLGRLSGLILGSVSQKVVSVAHCPVLVIP